MNILLTGGSGFIGRAVTARLEAAGHRVQTASRRTGLDLGRMQAASDWAPYLSAVDAVINCAGIFAERGGQGFEQVHAKAPIALFQACAIKGIRRIIQISAQGADEHARSAFHLSKRAADDFLRQMDLDWFVLRPSLVYGTGGYSAGVLLSLARLPLIPVLRSEVKGLQPVHVTDVACTVLMALQSGDTRRCLDLVGPDCFDLEQWLRLLGRFQGNDSARCIRVPLSLALLGAALGQFLHPMMSPAAIRMLIAARASDGQPWQHFLGRSPLKVSAGLLLPHRSGC